MGEKGKREDVDPRPFLEMDNDEPSQQSSESTLRESTSMVGLMECNKAQHAWTRKDKMDCGMESSKTNQALFGRPPSNRVPRLSSFRDSESDTMSMIKKARVSIRARSQASTVSELRIIKLANTSSLGFPIVLYIYHACSLSIN